MASLIRCVEGHVFDSGNGKCPICGWAVAPVTGGRTASSAPLQAPPGAESRLSMLSGVPGIPQTVMFAGLGAVSAAAVGLAIFFVALKPPTKPSGTVIADVTSGPSHDHRSSSADRSSSGGAPSTDTTSVSPSSDQRHGDKFSTDSSADKHTASAVPTPSAGTGGTPPAANPAAAPPKPSSKNLADELTEWGIPQQLVLQRNVGTYTPTTLPGARRITTDEMQQISDQALLIDVLDASGNHTTIPRAIHIPGAGNFGGGRFDDRLQRNFGGVLAQITNRNLDQLLVFFCEGAQCWESYNAALRAINMGYRQVLWYRGGLNSWKAANLPLVAPAGIYNVN